MSGNKGSQIIEGKDIGSPLAKKIYRNAKIREELSKFKKTELIDELIETKETLTKNLIKRDEEIKKARLDMARLGDHVYKEVFEKKKQGFEKLVDEDLPFIEKQIKEKQEDFKKSAKQCNFCGSYQGNLEKEIDELIMQKETLKELKQKLKND